MRARLLDRHSGGEHACRHDHALVHVQVECLCSNGAATKHRLIEQACSGCSTVRGGRDSAKWVEQTVEVEVLDAAQARVWTEQQATGLGFGVECITFDPPQPLFTQWWWQWIQQPVCLWIWWVECLCRRCWCCSKWLYVRWGKCCWQGCQQIWRRIGFCRRGWGWSYQFIFLDKKRRLAAAVVQGTDLVVPMQQAVAVLQLHQLSAEEVSTLSALVPEKVSVAAPVRRLSALVAVQQAVLHSVLAAAAAAVSGNQLGLALLGAAILPALRHLRPRLTSAKPNLLAQPVEDLEQLPRHQVSAQAVLRLGAAQNHLELDFSAAWRVSGALRRSQLPRMGLGKAFLPNLVHRVDSVAAAVAVLAAVLAAAARATAQEVARRSRPSASFTTRPAAAGSCRPAGSSTRGLGGRTAAAVAAVLAAAGFTLAAAAVVAVVAVAVVVAAAAAAAVLVAVAVSAAAVSATLHACHYVMERPSHHQLMTHHPMCASMKARGSGAMLGTRAGQPAQPPKGCKVLIIKGHDIVWCAFPLDHRSPSCTLFCRSFTRSHERWRELRAVVSTADTRPKKAG